MAATQSPPTIRFDEPQLRKLPSPLDFLIIVSNCKSGRFSTSGLSAKSAHSGEEPEAESDEEHPQDWAIETDEKDSWANRERRRASIWSKTDHNTPFAVVPFDGRRGSVLSIWSPGKDKNGKPILNHKDDAYEDGDDSDYAILDALPSPPESRKPSIAPAPNSPSLYPHSRRNTNDRKLSNGSQRRPSILGMWSPGKDEDGNAIMQHDDEEWNK
jgi:hypothetical protein